VRPIFSLCSPRWGSEKFTAFLVETVRFPGVTSGAEEQKMGIKGTSTTAVYFDNVPVPVENVLGEIGRAHIIAFNVLNVGRMKLVRRPRAMGKYVLAFASSTPNSAGPSDRPFPNSGRSGTRLPRWRSRIYAGESMLWRVAGLIESKMKEIAGENPDPPASRTQGR